MNLDNITKSSHVAYHTAIIIDHAADTTQLMTKAADLLLRTDVDVNNHEGSGEKFRSLRERFIKRLLEKAAEQLSKDSERIMHARRQLLEIADTLGLQ